MDFEEHVTDLLPAFALRCLDEAEAGRVEKHLATCRVCSEELRTYQLVADQLPLAVPMVEPPERIKRALMERIEALPPQAVRPPSRSGWWQTFSTWARQISPAWSLASLALILILVTSNLLLWRQVNTLAERQAGMQVVNLNGTNAAPDATAILVISLDGQHGTLVADKLPQLDEKQQFQLWLIDENGTRTSGGVFSVRDGYGSVWVKSPQPLISYPAFGVTIEPEGGSPAPTGDKVLGG
jgi:anti-sigma-K factor RskA